MPGNHAKRLRIVRGECMPVNIPDKLPAKAQLESENIFVMTTSRATAQDMRPLKIAILNLMPERIKTETQLLRLLGNTPLQVDIELVRPDSHTSKTTPLSHILAFCKPFSEIAGNKYDGFIITGAPVEHLEFEQVRYWQELCRIMDWANENVISTVYICWGALAGLYYHYSINKIMLDKKTLGVYPFETIDEHNALTRGFDHVFYAPWSCWASIDEPALKSNSDLAVLAISEEVGIHIAASKDYKHVFVMGHMEYDADTLAIEYNRDINKGIKQEIPYNYFPWNSPLNAPVVTWRAHGHLFFSNWLNYCAHKIIYNTGGKI